MSQELQLCEWCRSSLVSDTSTNKVDAGAEISWLAPGNDGFITRLQFCNYNCQNEWLDARKVSGNAHISDHSVIDNLIALTRIIDNMLNTLERVQLTAHGSSMRMDPDIEEAQAKITNLIQTLTIQRRGNREWLA